jgi:transposase-like protein
MEGRKEILGLYLSESEDANFWLITTPNKYINKLSLF